MFVPESPQACPQRSSATRRHITMSYSLSPSTPFPLFKSSIPHSFSSFLPTALSPSFSPGIGHCSDKSEKKDTRHNVMCPHISLPHHFPLSHPAPLPSTIIYPRSPIPHPLSLNFHHLLLCLTDTGLLALPLAALTTDESMS